ncbi:hypothetical protein ZIOFF_006644 [Zingiber officinale]|uniref:non-specific serine/threonine protein kinase n=1 Tax=Zingiber officinale TaxID=94328 RepID=A0A8J5I2V0_ZINOF|nr:hypothetical protein ZIOFF_006644 [Zingiber officinale]
MASSLATAPAEEDDNSGSDDSSPSFDAPAPALLSLDPPEASPSPEGSSPPEDGDGDADADDTPNSAPPPKANSSKSKPSPSSKTPTATGGSSSGKSSPESKGGGSGGGGGGFSPPSVPSASGNRTSRDGGSQSKSLPSPSGDSEASPSSGSSDVHLPLVLGVAGGVVLFLVLMIVSLVLCSRKKKKPVQYYDKGACFNQSHESLSIPLKSRNLSIQLRRAGGYYNAGSLPRWQNGGEYGGSNRPPQPGAGWRSPQPAGTMPISEDISGPYSGGFHGPPLPPPSPGMMPMVFNQSSFTYDELAAATNGFSRDNLLGQGGFGYVYKGVLPNRKEVAVKQLKAGSGQGEREFQAEVEIISRVHHRHLVSLVGYCIAGPQRLLVYEFVANNTLEHHLHGKGLPTMEWQNRLKIAIGSAKGLAYLHEDCHPRIIHRDIKTANILLDNKFEAMVADFGLAKLSSDTNTHVSTRVMGTFGYLAPEYASSGKLTEKSDVFSFGVMLLELVTGRRPVDNFSDMDESLVDWARPVLGRALADGNFDELADPRLEDKYNANEMARMAACAAASVRHSARRRPKMSQIVRALEGDVSLDDLNEGVKPGQSSMFSGSGSDMDSNSYSTNIRRFREIALGGNDGYSNDYNSTGMTSEYGANLSESSSSGEMAYGEGRRKKPSPYGV